MPFEKVGRLGPIARSIREMGRSGYATRSIREIGRAEPAAPASQSDMLRRARQEALEQKPTAADLHQMNRASKRVDGPSEQDTQQKLRVRFTDIHAPFVKKMREEQKKYYDRHIDKETSFAQWRKELKKAAEAIVECTEVWTRCTPKVLNAMLSAQNPAERRFKSLFETGSSSDLAVLESRKKEEKAYANYAKDLDPQLRVIYGYLSRDNQGHTKGPEWLDSYGEVRVCFKENVKQYTSFMVGDMTDMDDLLARPVPYERPNGDCFPLYTEADPRTFRSVDDIPPYRNDVYTPYAEAQIHYEAKVEDIAKVVIPTWDQELVDLLDAHRIPYEVAQER